jgi:hypothetical protein
LSTPLSDLVPFRFLSRPTPSPVDTCEDVKTAPRPCTPVSQAGTPLPAYAAPRSKALHNHTNSCLPPPAMNHLFSPLEVNRGMLHLVRCAPTKLPDPLRAAAPPRLTTTPCNAEETQGAQRLLFDIPLVLQRRPTFFPPARVRGLPLPSSPPPPLTRRSTRRHAMRKYKYLFPPYYNSLSLRLTCTYLSPEVPCCARSLQFRSVSAPIPASEWELGSEEADGGTP